MAEWLKAAVLKSRVSVVANVIAMIVFGDGQVTLFAPIAKHARASMMCATVSLGRRLTIFWMGAFFGRRNRLLDQGLE